MDRFKIGNRLLDLGFNPADKGFNYLIEAISAYKTGAPMAFIYNSVSEACKCKPANAERCIRSTREKTKIYKNVDNRKMIALIRWDIDQKEAKEVASL